MDQTPAAGKPSMVEQVYGVQLESNFLVGRALFAVKVFGVLLAVLNLATENVYLLRHNFASVSLLMSYRALVVFKIFIPLCHGIVSSVRQHKVNAKPLLTYTGVYRLCNPVTYNQTIRYGLLYELAFTFAFLAIQSFNNAILNSSRNAMQRGNSIQLFCILLKLMQIVELFAFGILHWAEHYRVYRLSAQIRRTPEKLYLKIALISLALAWLIWLTMFLASPNNKCPRG